ncbi:branched-chain amino acid ABC transporter permease [Pseudoroseomonas wenyumeiae]|uniref:Branched-chain amino acid ABC transporter permease n=1 Tax=Teichococcus wenyumeiae TaxID=2478470 RepID=A0A3A9JIJ6_9PROT|nr:branched-chain amino acid ABC transporter permease [Pseudoroseomonas wenyumeiae]RKK04603.1 branched-chain amino acid ABC transporter permease [Pseudoroseomonas wenyumeiae]RMI17365.1 branched-chain amino acid ABC transporter permease [Pseudoroseomonas wenyumeiae]
MKLFSGWRGDVLIALGALVLTALLVLGLGSNGLVDFTIRFGIFGLLVLSLNLLIGTSGLVSFGHAAFFGSGAYAFGLLMQSGGWSVPAAILASLASSALLALVIGALCVRLSEIYFAFLTLAFQMLIHSMIISWVSLTGGDQGLMGGVPKPPFLGIELARPQHLALFAAACLAVSAVLLRQVIRSPFGAALRMLRDNPQRAAFLGLSVFRYRLGAFVIAGTFAGLSGVLMSLYVSGAFPTFLYWTTSGEALFMIMLGGIGTFLGPLVGAAAFLFISDRITSFTEHHGLFFGAVLLLLVLGLRKGMLDWAVEAWRSRRERQKA